MYRTPTRSRARTLLAGLAVVAACAGGIIAAPAAHAAPLSSPTAVSGIMVKAAAVPNCPANLSPGTMYPGPFLQKNPWSPNIYVSRTRMCFDAWGNQHDLVYSSYLTAGTWANTYRYQAPSITYGLIGREYVEFANCARTSPTLFQGATGACVKAFQYAINNYYRKQGIPTIATDGVFGPATKLGVQRVQTAGGLFPTGWIDANTRHTINRALDGSWGGGLYTPSLGAYYYWSE